MKTKKEICIHKIDNDEVEVGAECCSATCTKCGDLVCWPFGEDYTYYEGKY